jgi:anthranilate synthase/indole-3-glycerol phosphate synthase/phosphoribosylanthranilate isomerase
MPTLIIDNYDSFTWNIYADVAVMGGEPIVFRNDEITIKRIDEMISSGEVDRIIISPGPGHPRTDSGISREVIKWGMGRVPLLGICMGLECLVDVLGGDVSCGLVAFRCRQEECS